MKRGLNNLVSFRRGNNQGKKVMRGNTLVWQLDTPTVQGSLTVDNIVIVGLGTTTADLNWSGWSDINGIASYDLEIWHLSGGGSLHVSLNLVNTTDSGVYNITGLNHLTFYDVKLRLVDANGDKSDWKIVNFSTIS